MARKCLPTGLLLVFSFGCSLPGGTVGFHASVTMPPTVLSGQPMDTTTTGTPTATFTVRPSFAVGPPPSSPEVKLGVPYAMPRAAPASDNPCR